MEILRSSNFKVYTISVPRVCVNFADVDGYTALHYACLRQNHKIADQLLQAGADTTAQWVVTYAIALFVVDTIYVRWHSEWSPCEKHAHRCSVSMHGVPLLSYTWVPFVFQYFVYPLFKQSSRALDLAIEKVTGT